MALILLVSAALGAIAVYQLIICPLFLSPLANIPAVHPLAKLSSLYMLWLRFVDDENDTVFAAHQKYGDVVRLGPQELSVNCVDDGIKTVYGKNFDRHYFYLVFSDCGRKNLSASLDASSHAMRKKRIANIYSKSYLQNSPSVAGLMNRVIRDRYLPKVTKSAEDGCPFDSMNLFSAMAIDLITGLNFGVKNGTNFLNNKEEHAWLTHEIHNGRPYPMMYWLQEFPGTVAWLERWSILSNDRYQSLEALHVYCLHMCDRAENALADSSAQEAAPEDFPTVYQQFKRALDKEGLSSIRSIEEKHARLPSHKPITCSPQQLEIAAELCDQIHASDETLSSTLTYAMWELSRNVPMQERLRKECQSLSATSLVALPPAKVVDALPLMHAIIYETLRVHPLVAGGQARVTPYGKLSKLGKYENIPGGIRVQSYARFLHQNEEVFPDPLSWVPERWLAENNSSQTDQKMRWFWAFSSGARMCLGQHLGLMGEYSSL